MGELKLSVAYIMAFIYNDSSNLSIIKKNDCQINTHVLLCTFQRENNASNGHKNKQKLQEQSSTTMACMAKHLSAWIITFVVVRSKQDETSKVRCRRKTWERRKDEHGKGEGKGHGIEPCDAGLVFSFWYYSIIYY